MKRIAARVLRAKMRKIKSMMPRFETEGRLRQRQDKVVTVLSSAGVDASSLHKCRLEACSSPTCSGACHWASTRLRIECISRAPKLLDAPKTLVHMVSIIPQDPRWRRKPGDLRKFNLELAHEYVEQRLGWLWTITNLRAIGMVDVSFNRSVNGAPHWQLHLHLVVAGASHTDLVGVFREDTLKPHHKPLRVENVYDLTGALGYVLKHLTAHKLGRFKRQPTPTCPRPRPRDRHPGAAAWCEFQQWLHELSPTDRMVLFGLEQTGGRLRPDPRNSTT